MLITAVSAAAQTAPQQQYVYASVPVAGTSASEIAGFSKNATGGLLSVGSPLSDTREGGALAVDVQGRFLFVLNPNSNNISMFRIDRTTGSVTEVPGSPFAVGFVENPSMRPTSPAYLATEASGQFLYVGYRNGNFPGKSAIIEYQIDPNTPRLVPPVTAAGTSDLPAAPIGMVTDPKGQFLYVGLGPESSCGHPGRHNQRVPNCRPVTFDSRRYCRRTEPLPTNHCPRSTRAFLFDGWGSTQGFLESALINHADGTATSTSPPVSLGLGKLPSALLVENSGKFLYVQQSDGTVAVHFIDSKTGSLTPATASTSTLNFQTASAAADPLGPYIYSLQNDGVHAYQITDAQTGVLSPIQGSPSSVAPGAGVGGIAISGTPVQAVSGPAAALSPPSLDFGSITVGHPITTQTIALTDIGDQALAVSSVSITGANPADFTETHNCPPLLQPRVSCTVSLIFTPTTTGPRQATLTISDNAPGGSQSAQLTGTGVPPPPAVTLVPGTLSFPDTNQGTTSASQRATLTSAGMATLHISSVSLTGSNPNDFNLIKNTCTGRSAGHRELRNRRDLRPIRLRLAFRRHSHHR